MRHHGADAFDTSFGTGVFTREPICAIAYNV